MSPNGYIRRRRADVIEDTVRDVRSSPTRRPVVFAIILLRPETLRRLRPSWRSRRRRVRRFVHFPTMCDSTPSDDARPPSRPSNATPRSLFFAQCRQPPAFTGLQTAFIPLPDLRFDISHPQLSHRPSAAQKPHPKPVSFPFRPFFRTRVRPPHSNFASTRQRPRLLHRTYLLQCRLNSTTNQLTRPVVFLASFSQISMLTPDFLPGPHRNACTHAPAAVHPVDRSIAPRTHRRTPRYTQTFTFVLDAPHFATNPIYRLYHPRISSLFFAITSPHPKPTTTHSLHAASLHARRTHARTRDHPPRHCIAFLRSKNGPNFQLHRRRRHLKTSNHSIPPFSPSYPSPNFRAPPSPQRNSKRSLSASKSDRNGPITRRLFRPIAARRTSTNRGRPGRPARYIIAHLQGAIFDIVVRIFVERTGRWLVPSRPLASRPEERRQGSSWQPRLPARVHRLPEESRSPIVTGPEPSLFVRSVVTRSRPSC